MTDEDLVAHPFNARRAFVEDVINTLNGERNKDYGNAVDSFTRIASFWSTYLSMPIDARDVAVMMALMKISRLTHTKEHIDSWRDLAGYAVLGATMYE